MPPSGRAPAGTAAAAQYAARRAAEELVAAAAAEPTPGGAAVGPAATLAPAPARAATLRVRVCMALVLLRQSLAGSSPAGAAAAALGVGGLLAALLREAGAPPGPHATEAAECIAAIHKAAGSEGGSVAAALSAAVLRDAACLFDAMGRAAAMQAAARSAGGAASAGSAAAPPAGAGLSTAAAAGTPGLQLFALLCLACHPLSEVRGPDEHTYACKAFARSAAAVDATLEVLLHGCAPFGALPHQQAADALSLVCNDLTGVRHLRGAFSRVVPAVLERLERGAPRSTLEERMRLVLALRVRRGRARLVQGGRKGRLRRRLRAAPGSRYSARAAPSAFERRFRRRSGAMLHAR
jgi:hypothetical protein